VRINLKFKINNNNNNNNNNNKSNNNNNNGMKQFKNTEHSFVKYPSIVLCLKYDPTRIKENYLLLDVWMQRNIK